MAYKETRKHLCCLIKRYAPEHLISFYNLCKKTQSTVGCCEKALLTFTLSYLELHLEYQSPLVVAVEDTLMAHYKKAD